VIDWEVLERVLGRRQDALHLIAPVFPRIGAPRVIRPDEAAFFQIRAKRVNLFCREYRVPVIGDRQEWAFE
jgi:hypothetical protein